MAALHPNRAVTAVLLCASIALSACPSTSIAPCNADTDCDDGLACSLGLCVPADEPDDDAGTNDAGPRDAGAEDAGTNDAGIEDAGVFDAGPSDAGESDAGPPDAGGCPPGEHDGGDGACLAVGLCSSGFALYFVDADLDGVGAGALSEECAPEPLEAGRALAGDDCEPDDPTRFQLQLGFDDGDLDGYTAGPAQACVGDVPEQGILDQERGPPMLAYAASASSSGFSNPWNSVSNAWGCCGGPASADMDPAADTATLVLSDFSCLSVPPRLDLVRVRARVRLPSGQPEELALEVTLLDSGAAGATRTATSTWLGGTFSDVELIGSAADWGLTTTDPAALCAGALDAEVVVLANGSYGGSAEIDYVVVELLGGDDCDPGSPTLFSPMSLYGDGDNDTHVGGPPVAGCVGGAALTAWAALVPVDCDDTDADAHPGQTSYFTNQRNGGGWDYNCNGSDDKRSVSDASGCVEDAAAPGTCLETGSTSRSGDCGAQVDADDCPAVAPCNLVQDTDPIACR